MKQTQQKMEKLKLKHSKVKQICALLLIFSATFTSCKKDQMEVDAPFIQGLEIGHDNNKTAYPGTDIHIEAELIATGKLSNVKLEILPRSGNGWRFEKEYKDGLTGMNNATFHQHIDVPANAALGHYQVIFIVTDQQGVSTRQEAELEVKFDPSLPSAADFEVVLNAAGNDLHLEAILTAQQKIANVEVEIHGAGWEKEFKYIDAAMVGQTTYKLHKHTDVTAAPAGHYHVHLKITDQAGKENEFEAHFDKR